MYVCFGQHDVTMSVSTRKEKKTRHITGDQLVNVSVLVVAYL